MKKSKNFTFAVTSVLLLLFNIVVTSTNARNDKDFEVVVPDGLVVKGVRLFDLEDTLHLSFSIKNKTGSDLSKLNVRIIGYTKDGKIIVSSRREIDVKLPNDKKTSVVEKAYDKLRSAHRYKVEFSIADSQMKLTEAESDCCTQCGRDAVEVCGRGQVSSVSCRSSDTNGTSTTPASGTCSCDYSCKDAPAPSVTPTTPINP